MGSCIFHEAYVLIKTDPPAAILKFREAASAFEIALKKILLEIPHLSENSTAIKRSSGKSLQQSFFNDKAWAEIAKLAEKRTKIIGENLVKERKSIKEKVIHQKATAEDFELFISIEERYSHRYEKAVGNNQEGKYEYFYSLIEASEEEKIDFCLEEAQYTFMQNAGEILIPEHTLHFRKPKQQREIY